MSTRTASWLAWLLWALSVALTALSLLLLALSVSHPGVHIFDHWLDSTLAAIAFSTVGAVIAPRTPSDNPEGWLFCVVGLLFAVAHFSAEYALYALLAAPGSQLPAGEAAAWPLAAAGRAASRSFFSFSAVPSKRSHWPRAVWASCPSRQT